MDVLLFIKKIGSFGCLYLAPLIDYQIKFKLLDLSFQAIHMGYETTTRIFSFHIQFGLIRSIMSIMSE